MMRELALKTNSPVLPCHSRNAGTTGGVELIKKLPGASRCKGNKLTRAIAMPITIMTSQTTLLFFKRNHSPFSAVLRDYDGNHQSRAPSQYMLYSPPAST